LGAGLLKNGAGSPSELATNVSPLEGPNAMTNIHDDAANYKSPPNPFPTFTDDQPLTVEDWQRHFRSQIELARCAILTDSDRERVVWFVKEHINLIYYPPDQYPGDFEEVGWNSGRSPCDECFEDFGLGPYPDLLEGDE
jgi:hypothetical protein